MVCVIIGLLQDTTHPLFLHPKPFTATGHLPAMLPKSPQILASQDRCFTVSKYIMHLHPVLSAWNGSEQLGLWLEARIPVLLH